MMKVQIKNKMKILLALFGCSTAIDRCDQETIVEGKGEIGNNHRMNFNYIICIFT